MNTAFNRRIGDLWRTRGRFVLHFCLAATLWGSCVAELPRAAAEKPNIVLIYTDDQGYGDVSALNPKAKFRTPNLDRLISEGMTFTDGHCSDTVCTPSRYGLLTGRYSWRTKLKRGVMGADADCLIENGRMTLCFRYVNRRVVISKRI